MVSSLIGSMRRYIAKKVYSPPKWEDYERLSVSGIFDFAFDEPTKREVVESVGKSNIGGRKDYSEDQFASIDGICWESVYREYMDNYLDSTDDKSVQKMNALRRYVKYEAIPELVECRVLEVRVRIGDDEHVVAEDVQDLLENNVIEAYQHKYKSSGQFVPNLHSDAEIIGARPGERFDFAFRCLDQISVIDSRKESIKT